jgi:hypothetical protein
MRRGRKLSVVAVAAAGVVVVAAVVMAAVAVAMVVAVAVEAAAVDVAEIVEIAETAGKKGLPDKSGVPTTRMALEIFLKYPQRALCACQPLVRMQHFRWKSVYEGRCVQRVNEKSGLPAPL